MGAFVDVDLTSLILLGVIVCTLVVGILLRPPPPLIHPFLLGRQSIPSQSRLKGESPVYLNSITAGTRPPVRPDKEIQTVQDVLDQSLAKFGSTPAGVAHSATWVKGGESVKETAIALRAGLLSKLGQGTGNVAVMVDEPTG